VLELGQGPDDRPPDADLELAARGAVWAAFMNTGQSCASVERVYVAEEIAAEFARRVVEFTAGLRVGNPTDPDVDVGPMENLASSRWSRNMSGRPAKGAEILCGGRG